MDFSGTQFSGLLEVTKATNWKDSFAVLPPNNNP
jgi:hypothetical protein